jgi:hypothetical protein
MSRLVDPTICPDCRGALDPGATCTACGLAVTGPLAQQLWQVMVTADGLVEQLRAGVAVRERPAPAKTVSTAGLPDDPIQTDPRPRTRLLPAASVPVVLLSLGAVCLLVAAIVFVAVTWSLLGLTGRTLVLLGFTTILVAVAVVVTRKDLRGSAETFWLVVAGMLTVDLLAAESAGLAGLDALTERDTAALVGGVLVVLGVVVGTWARLQPVGRLYGAESVAVLGTLVVCSTNVWAATDPAIACTLAVPVLAVAFLLLRQVVPLAAYGMGGWGLATWLVLLGIGADRALQEAVPGDWWRELRGWPLAAAAALAALAVHAPKVPALFRSPVAAAALLPLALLANAPQVAGAATLELVRGCGTVLALALAAAFGSRAWAQGAAALTVLGAAAAGVALLGAPWSSLLALDLDGSAAIGTTMPVLRDGPAAWALLVAAGTIVVAAVCLLRHVPMGTRERVEMCLRVLAPAVLSLGGLGLVLDLQPPLWAGVLAAAVATAVAGAGAWWGRTDLVAGWLGSAATAYLAAVMSYAALAADLLAALVATSLFLGLAVVAALRDRTGAQPSAAIASAASALVGGWALPSWGLVMGADVDANALALAGYAGLVGVLARPVARRTATRLALEVSAATLAVVAVGLTSTDASAAMVLTVVGSAICLVAVTAFDRSLLGWMGAMVLGLATIIRVSAGTGVPELYTLPVAVLLVAVGAWQLRVHPEWNSFTMMGSGLMLALLPSLLLALEEPVSLRGALVGAGGVLVLGAGVQLRLAAPFVLGAATTGVLALRHLGPVADAVPRWLSLGGVGLVLLVVGVTWEARRRDLEQAQRYLTALR